MNKEQKQKMTMPIYVEPQLFKEIRVNINTPFYTYEENAIEE